MKRTLDILAYGVAGLALAGGAVYGWRLLVQPPPTPPVPPLVQPATHSPAAKAAAPAPPPALPAPPAPPAPVADAPTTVDTAAAQYAQDQARFYELQNGCYEAAANNRNGDYPTFQTMACERYARFAAERGWDPGTLPAYGQPAPQPAEPEPVAQQPQDQQVILLGPVYDDVNRHRPSRPQPNVGSRPQQQIGPNYPLPPPQPQPPVSQRQQLSKRMPAPGPQN